jgi:hypothetical protein
MHGSARFPPPFPILQGKLLSANSLYFVGIVVFSFMTLHEASQRYPVSGLHHEMIDTQEEAFQTCLSFLEGIERAKGQNNRHDSYGYKHIVENPAGRYDIPSSLNCYGGYVYEGTFILAALASGFTMQQNGGPLHATFNISERSLRKRAIEVAAFRANEPVLVSH